MPATLIGALAVALPSDLEAAVLGVKKEIPGYKGVTSMNPAPVFMRRAASG